MKSTIAIDQYGQHYDDLGKHPRKALLEKLGHSSAQKMYIDKKDGSTCHVGYIIGGLRLTIYNISSWEKPA
jgi:hypothetical protein